jgi:hypothetical protein
LALVAVIKIARDVLQPITIVICIDESGMCPSRAGSVSFFDDGNRILAAAVKKPPYARLDR